MAKMLWEKDADGRIVTDGGKTLLSLPKTDPAYHKDRTSGPIRVYGEDGDEIELVSRNKTTGRDAVLCDLVMVAEPGTMGSLRIFARAESNTAIPVDPSIAEGG